MDYDNIGLIRKADFKQVMTHVLIAKEKNEACHLKPRTSENSLSTKDSFNSLESQPEERYLSPVRK